MSIELATLLALLIKHWYIDFVNQTTIEVHGKGIYGNLHGLWHSAKQGIFTALIFFNLDQPYYGVLVGFVDFASFLRWRRFVKQRILRSPSLKRMRG